MKLTLQELDLTGQRFGRLVVVEYFLNENNRHYYLCNCDCGNETVVRRNELLANDTRSCGCLQRETRLANIKKKKAVKIIHGHMVGHRPTPTYTTWRDMKSKCDNEKSIQWHNFGGKKISYDSNWHNFKNFLHDMGTRPGGTFLRRKDQKNNFTSDNCEWSPIAGYYRPNGK